MKRRRSTVGRRGLVGTMLIASVLVSVPESALAMDPDAIPPTVDMDHAIDTVFTGPDVTITGWAADDVGVTAVEVAIKDRVTKQFLHADGTWGSYAVVPVALDDAGALFTTWSIGAILPAAGYNIESWAYDAAGNRGKNPTWKKFNVVDQGADVQAPNVTASHVKGAVFIEGSVIISGTATDDTGVTAVDIRIKNRDTALWLQADGSFAPGAVWHATALDVPGATSVTWTIDVPLPPGRYNPVSQASDAAGNSDTQHEFLPIEVVPDGGQTDVVVPNVAVDHGANEVFSAPQVTLTGIATDNVGVTQTHVKLKDRESGEWLQADGSFGSGAVWHDAALDDPGATSTTWTVTVSLPSGLFNPVAEALDAAGNAGVQNVFSPIEVIPPGGVPVTRTERCQAVLDAALRDPELTQTQKNYVSALCAGDAAAEGAAEPQGVMAPEIFPNHPTTMNDPNEVGDRVAHALHCMDTSAERFGLVAIPTNPSTIDLTKPGGSAPLNYAGEFLLVEIGGVVRLFNRVIFWQVRPDNQPVLIKHQILKPGGTSNTTVARVYNAPQFQPMTIWSEIESSILEAYPADLNAIAHDYIIPGRIMNLRTWYSDTYCHDKRAEHRVPQLVLDYAVATGFGEPTSSLSAPTRLRLSATGDPQQASSWDVVAASVVAQNTQSTNSFKWFYGADVFVAGEDGNPPAGGIIAGRQLQPG